VLNIRPFNIVVSFDNISGTVERVATNGNELNIRIARVRRRIRRERLQLVEGGRTASATSRPKIWKAKTTIIKASDNGRGEMTMVYPVTRKQKTDAQYAKERNA
jgi:hypothetical protein